MTSTKEDEAFEKAVRENGFDKPGYLSGGEKVWMRKGFSLAWQAAQSVPVVGEPWRYVVNKIDGTPLLSVCSKEEADKYRAREGLVVFPVFREPNGAIHAAELAILREKAARIEQVEKERDEANARLHDVSVACATAEQERDELRKDAERLPVLEHTLRHLGRELAKLDKYRLCMSYNDSYFGEPAGTVKLVVVELRQCIDAALAQGKGE